MNIVEDIRRSAVSYPAHTAVVEEDGEVSYGELLDRVSFLRRGLREEGIGPGRRVAFRCSDGAAYIAASLALLESGAATVPVDGSLPPSEVVRLLERMDVDALLFERGTMHESTDDREIGAARSGIGFMLRPRGAASPMPALIKRINPAFIRFSSGTTGASKGVVLSHDTIRERTDAADEALKIGMDDRILWVLSMSHHFVVSILLFLRRGATIAVAHKNFPASIFETAMQGRITLIYASPLHYHLLASDPAVTPQALRKVRLAISTAMKLPAETAEAFESKFGFFPAEAYGIIEVGLPFIDPAPAKNSLGSVGRLLPAYRMRVENPDECGVGEILLRGRGMFDAYLSPPRLRDDVLEQGWFRTGDLGCLDGEGNLRIAGRSKSVIICAGMKVFPEEVEEVLNAHVDVQESLVYGVPHPVYGQIPEARIVTARDDIDAGEINDVLRRYCYAALPPYCVPKRFESVRELARTVSGKLVRA